MCVIGTCEGTTVYAFSPVCCKFSWELVALRFFEVRLLNPLEDYFVRKLIPKTTLAHCPHFFTACVYRPLPCTHTPQTLPISRAVVQRCVYVGR